MHSRWIGIITVMAIILLQSCEKESTSVDYRITDPVLQQYFDRFEEEAADRGISIDLDSKQIFGVLDDLENNTVGNCTYSPNSPRQVTIDRDYWNNAIEAEKEFVVFHELGHCYLERSHDDSRNNRGVCTSIMNSGTSSCRSGYNGFTRAAYLDELFK